MKNINIKSISLFLVAAVILAIMLFPLYWVVNISFQTENQIFNNPPHLFPPTPSFDAYTSVFVDQWPHLVTSLIIALGAVVLSLIISVPAAFAITHFKLKGANIFIIILLISQMIPGVSLANGLFNIYDAIGLLNSYLGLILAVCTFSIPFNILILQSFMISIPKELIESAFLDGASDWRAFFSIIIPVSKTGIITTSLFAFLFAWGDFLFGVTMTGGGDIEPFTVSLYGFISQHSVSWGQMMATAILGSIPTAFLLVISQRYITSGITGGSVKG